MLDAQRARPTFGHAEFVMVGDGSEDDMECVGHSAKHALEKFFLRMKILDFYSFQCSLNTSWHNLGGARMTLEIFNIT